MKRVLGRFLQASGLIIAPMALFYYIENASRAAEGKLASMELLILATAAGIFILGRLIEGGGKSGGGPAPGP